MLCAQNIVVMLLSCFDSLHAALNSSVMSTQQHLQSGQHRQARSVVSKRLCSIYLVADYL